ncbi:MAG TPA: rhomboid family intramembrane serine protease [Solirubrobacteraceae bacterium]|jgi:membrane associated rhomboid family serine protease
MIPIKDNIPREHFPLVTATVVVAVVAIYVFSSHRVGVLPFLLDAGFLALLGPSVENRLGRVRFAGLCVFAGAMGVGVWALAGTGTPSPLIAGTLGVVVGVLAIYLLLFPHARVLTLVPVPLYTTLVEIPAGALIGMWVVVQVVFGVVGLGDPVGMPSLAQASLAAR